MRIAHKLVIGLTVPAALIWGVGIYATRTSEDALVESIERTSAAHARAVMDGVDHVVHTRIADWVALTHSPRLRDALVEANAAFETHDDIDGLIDARDAAWQAVPDETASPLMTELLTSELSRELRIRLEELEAETGYAVFGEVFVTNRYGANVAMTNRTSDYRQNDEAWWVAAARDETYIGDVEFDESAGVFSVDICLGIDDGAGALLGVMKVVYDVRELREIIDKHATELPAGARLGLFTADHRIIHVAGMGDSTFADGSQHFAGVTVDAPTLTRERLDPVTGAELMSTYAASLARYGVDELGWTVLLEYEADLMLGPVRTLRRNILIMATAATVVAILIAGGVAFPLSRRIGRLVGATDAFARGERDVHVDDAHADELGRLARSHNEMSTIISRDFRSRDREASDMDRARRTADAANAAKSEFLSGISRRLRLPLSGILGQAQILRRDPSLEARQVSRVDAVEASGQEMLTMLDDLLELSRIEAGEIELDEQPCDVHQLACRAVDGIRARAEAGGIAMVVEAEDDIPASILVDQTRLRQVLSNVLRHAVRFTEEGSVTLQLGRSGERLQIRVEDTGIGMTDREMDEIFDPFRGETDASGGELGLAISRRLVSAMGGLLDVDSAAGRGTTFTIMLPLREASAAPAQRTAAVTPVDDTLETAPIARRIRAAVRTENIDALRVLVGELAAANGAAASLGDRIRMLVDDGALDALDELADELGGEV